MLKRDVAKLFKVLVIGGAMLACDEPVDPLADAHVTDGGVMNDGGVAEDSATEDGAVNDSAVSDSGLIDGGFCPNETACEGGVLREGFECCWMTTC